MCRSKADGGRRCDGHHGSSDRESYRGTQHQGYDEAQERFADVRRRVASGNSISDIMSQDTAQRAADRIAQIQREGW